MAKARKNIQVSQDSWEKFNRLKKRYDTPISQLLENIVDTNSFDELDQLFGYKKKKVR